MNAITRHGHDHPEFACNGRTERQETCSDRENPCLDWENPCVDWEKTCAEPAPRSAKRSSRFARLSKVDAKHGENELHESNEEH